MQSVELVFSTLQYPIAHVAAKPLASFTECWLSRAVPLAKNERRMEGESTAAVVGQLLGAQPSSSLSPSLESSPASSRAVAQVPAVRPLTEANLAARGKGMKYYRQPSGHAASSVQAWLNP